MIRKSTVAVTCFTCAALLAAGPQLAQATSRPRPGNLKIRRVKFSVMVNTPVTVKGTRFPRNTAVTLRECGRTLWLVPEEPCNMGNEVTVQTSSRGSFTTSMKAEVCPEGMPRKEITERTCYIGVVKFGEDTGELSPSAQLIVTYP